MPPHVATAEMTSRPSRVLKALSDPQACLSWAPVPLELTGDVPAMLTPGATARVRGHLGAANLEFDLQIQEASADRFAVRAEGPFVIDVEYRFSAESMSLAVQTTKPRGLTGRCLKAASDALLAAGILDDSLRRLQAHASTA